MSHPLDNEWHGTKARKGSTHPDWSDNSTTYRHRRRRLCGCPFCPPHDVENRGRRPKPDRNKNKRRA